jgi:mycothiol synthase
MRVLSNRSHAAAFASRVPGLTLRAYAPYLDLTGIAGANQAARDGANRMWPVTEAWMAAFLERFGSSDPDRDMVVAERDGRIIGYARVAWRDEADGARVVYSQCIVRPEDRGHGIGTAMLAWTEARMEALAREIPGRGPDYRATFSWGDDPGAARLLRDHGWREDGRGYEMVRPSLDNVPDVPLPDGLEVRRVRDDQRGAVWEALTEAFVDHRGQGTKSEADRRQFLEDPAMRPDLWVIAWDGSEIAGGVLNMLVDRPDGRPGGLGRVDGVFTRRPWRRRGLARALTARSVERLRDRGATIVELSVDGANPNDAMTLYTSLGFEIRAVETHWIKPYGNNQRAEDEP